MGSRTATLEVSPVRQFDDYGPDVDVVRAWILWDDGKVLALRDVYPNISRQEAYRLWSVLCEQLTNAAALSYGIEAELGANPRLGCWGPRPDFAEAGVDDDSATAVMVGVAIDKKLSRAPRRDLLILAVRSAIVATLQFWTAAARGPSDRPNGNGH